MIEVGEVWKLLRKNFFLFAFALFDVQALRMCLRYLESLQKSIICFKYYFVSSLICVFRSKGYNCRRSK